MLTESQILGYELVLHKRNVLIVCNTPNAAEVSIEIMDEKDDFYEGERYLVFPSEIATIMPYTGIRIRRVSNVNLLMVCNTTIKTLLLMDQSKFQWNDNVVGTVNDQGNWNLEPNSFFIIPKSISELFIEEHPVLHPRDIEIPVNKRPPFDKLILRM